MLEIYVDGSCNYFYNFKTKEMDGNKNGGIGIAIYENLEFIKGISESYKDTTNQKMELLAIIRALEEIKEDFILYSDSQYALNCTGKWYNSEIDKYYTGWIFNWEKNGKLYSDIYEDGKPILFNRYYIRRIHELIKKRNIKLVWVRGHKKNKGNIMADELSFKRGELKNCVYDEMEIEYYSENIVKQTQINL